ncbi:hypothetical protein BJX76DRAFT_60944 [Aspergillus varians]
MSASYCNICGGPLSSEGLRALSTIQPGDDPTLAFDDACSCDHELYDDEYDGGHDDLCPSNNGYNGKQLSYDKIAWLDRVRMLKVSDYGESQQTDIGKYIPGKGLALHSLEQSMNVIPKTDGLLIHDTCWRMLEAVHKKHNHRLGGGVNAQHLGLTMQYFRTKNPRDTCINWENDPRLYGGAELFHLADLVQEWEPIPGQEWIVTDPMNCPDFSSLVAKTMMHSRTRDQSTHVQIMPATITCLSIPLDDTFLRSSIFRDLPWLRKYGRPLKKTVNKAAKGKIRLDYTYLTERLKEVSAVPVPGEFRPDFWELRNRARIWNCCEAILENVRAFFE